ncbi:hypothetical protein U1Q18_007724 [Sarracenia purpurea var. burkii]
MGGYRRSKQGAKYTMSREDGTIGQDALSFDLGAGIKDCTVLFQLGAAFDDGILAFGVCGRTLPGWECWFLETQ